MLAEQGLLWGEEHRKCLPFSCLGDNWCWSEVLLTSAPPLCCSHFMTFTVAGTFATNTHVEFLQLLVINYRYPILFFSWKKVNWLGACTFWKKNKAEYALIIFGLLVKPFNPQLVSNQDGWKERYSGFVSPNFLLGKNLLERGWNGFLRTPNSSNSVWDNELQWLDWLTASSPKPSVFPLPESNSALEVPWLQSMSLVCKHLSSSILGLLKFFLKLDIFKKVASA